MMSQEMEIFIIDLKKEIYAELVGCWKDEQMYAYENVIRIIDRLVKDYEGEQE